MVKTARPQNTEERLKLVESILDDSHDMIVAGDNHGMLIEYNKGAEKLLGYKKKELLGKPISVLYYNPHDRKKLVKDLEEKGSLIDYTIKLMGKDGKMVPASTTISYLKDDDDNIMGTVGIAKNIFERRQGERRKMVRMFHQISIIVMAVSISIFATYYGARFFSDDPLKGHLENQNQELNNHLTEMRNDNTVFKKQIEKLGTEIKSLQTKVSEQEESLSAINNCRVFVPKSAIGENVLILKKELPYSGLVTTFYWEGILKEVKKDSLY